MFRTIKSWLKPTAPAARPQPKLALTALEAREVPATLSVLGTDGVVRIAADTRGATVEVRNETVYGSAWSKPTTNVVVKSTDADGTREQRFDQWSVTLVEFTGSAQADTFRNTSAENCRAFGGDGADYLTGGNGDDYLDGQVGDDDLFGMGGIDRLVGDIGDDDLYGGDQDDVVAGGLGADYVAGGAGADQLEGGRDADQMRVDAADFVYGDQTGDMVVGSTGFNRRFAENTQLGWFDEYMTDGSTRRVARPTVLDGWVDRKDMLAVLEHVSHGADVSSTEYSSLRNFTASVPANVRPDARDLAMNVTHGDPANRYWTGGTGTRLPLGDLAVGSSGPHLQKLVDKWFRGADLPMAKNYTRDTTYGYAAASGNLFVSGPSADDVDQGMVGDCYLLAGLGAVARQNPAAVEQMFADNGDGTFTVRFFNNGVAQYATVNRQLPVNADGRFVFANDGDRADSAANELWVALAEKAFVQLNESGWVKQDGTNSYNGSGGAVSWGENVAGVNGGWCGETTQMVTGRLAAGLAAADFSFDRLRAEFDAGKAVVFNTQDAPRADVVDYHCYTMTGYNAAAGTITLRNPHGDWSPVITLSVADLKANFVSAEFIPI